MGNKNYPPENLYSHSKWKRPNYDYIILWMLNNNEICKWADFCKEPIEIPTGTLSRHLEPLKCKGYVEKAARRQYKITPEGKIEFNLLSSAKKNVRKLNYPPKIILKSGRNYDDWILWMVIIIIAKGLNFSNHLYKFMNVFTKHHSKKRISIPVKSIFLKYNIIFQ